MPRKAKMTVPLSTLCNMLDTPPETILVSVDLVEDPRHNHRIEVARGVLADDAGVRLTNYFRRKRGKPPL